MILDTSAVIAILCGEPDTDRYRIAIACADRLAIGAPTLVECGIVAQAKLGEHGPHDLDNFIRRLHVEVRPFGEREAAIARYAFNEFGKGRHPAGLNFGDCLTYATTANDNDTLLYKGDDFLKTPIHSALAR